LIRAIIVLLSILILVPVTASAEGDRTLQLNGDFTQGGLIVGQVDPGATVEFDGRNLRVSSDGHFLFGLGRDAPAKVELTVRMPDGYVHVQEIEVAQREYKVQRIDGLPPKKVSPPPEAIEQIVREKKAKEAAFKADLAETGFLADWIWPAEGPISGVYGSQRVLNGKPRRPHYGVDVASPVGTPVVAPADGTVVLALPEMYFEGNAIFLDHGHGLKSVYMHLSELDVKEGQKVTKGQRIGAIGATGRVTGPHLHWALYWFRTPLDPALLVPERPGSRG
jgi:murein DD-endopeptidase MepM/ murein hydrolase activator NlpD